MIPGRIANSTRVFNAPPGSEERCDPLAVRDGKDGLVPTMTSAWYPSPEEVKRMSEGAPVYLTVWGNVHPPVALNVGENEL